MQENLTTVGQMLRRQRCRLGAHRFDIERHHASFRVVRFFKHLDLIERCPQVGRAERFVLVVLQTILIVEVNRPKFAGLQGERHVVRSIEPRQQAVLLGSGCGVVAESKLLSEWQELKMKRDQVKDLLGL